MPIQILPPILANQIAAGEVVERPASVVKELVENCLDAGATRIEIELEKGGCQLIRIRDNGGGIPSDELPLALARHATSKVHTLDDLNQILSLGFRGEALASISSVSRLKLTSRTESQTEAWQAYAEGREMAVTVKPASHPVGTTVEAQDLFFNTPARRRFLKSEKTEFGHIDEWLRRLALSRFDVALTLKHNGKLIRQYRVAETQAQQQQRLAMACGQEFTQKAIQFSNEHLGMSLSGWVCHQTLKSIVDLQYCYVNGRVMRDKLLMHAVRQAYTEAYGEFEPSIAYVIYLSIDPLEVDVNVHPAKHEVRFHESRQVHDYLVRVIKDVLISAPNEHLTQKHSLSETPSYPVHPLQFKQGATAAQASATSSRYPSNDTYRKDASVAEIREYAQQYDNLYQVSAPISELESHVEMINQTSSSLIRQQYVTAMKNDCLYLVDLKKIYAAFWFERLSLLLSEGLKSQPLLIPVRLQFPHFQRIFSLFSENLNRLGLKINHIATDKFAVYSVPELIRHRNLTDIVPVILQQLDANSETSVTDEKLLHILINPVADTISTAELQQSQPELMDWFYRQPIDWCMKQKIAAVIDIDFYIEALRRE